MEKIKANAKHIFAIISLIFSVLFGVLNICGVKICINELDFGNLLFSLSFLIAIFIEVFPQIKDLIKNKNLAKILNIIKIVVDSVEELKDLTGEQKKNIAMDAASKELLKIGLNIDFETISKLIEEVVLLRNNIVK